MAESRTRVDVAELLRRITDSAETVRPEKPTYHPFPARMPVWLAQEIIEAVSEPGGTVLDPMVGSGSTGIAALLAGRSVIACDMDPMALLLTRVGTTVFDRDQALQVLVKVSLAAKRRMEKGLVVAEVRAGFEQEDQEFLAYWFPPRSQKELFALATEIATMPAGKHRNLAWIVFSSLIIAKSAGASYALDIARSRPHKVEGKPIVKPFDAWQSRAKAVLKRLPLTDKRIAFGAQIRRADARRLPVEDQCVDLVLTSPPYLNAIDYIRAHKFSLVWMGRPLSDLRDVRGRMIGTERGMYSPDSLPQELEKTMADSIGESRRLGLVRRYLSDMRRVLLEIKRVLKPDGTVVMSLGPSVISREDIDAGEVLGGLAESVGLVNVGSSFRPLENARRSLPPPFLVGRANPLRQRMDGEVFLVLRKR